MCGSRPQLSNEYLLVLAKISADTAENEPSRVSASIPTQAIKFHIFIPLQVLLPPGGAPGESGAVPSVAEARPSTVFFLRPASDLPGTSKS